MAEIFKYEINGVYFETSRPLTDAEMRHILDNPSFEYWQLLKVPPFVKPGDVWLDKKGNEYVRNWDNTRWLQTKFAFTITVSPPPAPKAAR